MKKLDNVKAILFDLDGTLVDTEKLWLDLAEEISKEMDLELPFSMIFDSIGRRSKETREAFADYLGKELADTFFARYKTLRDEYMIKFGLPLKTGALEILDFAKKQGYKIALASSSYKEKILRYLANAKIDPNYFDSLIAGDMVENPKPHPEIYNLTMTALNVKPEECIVIEDSNIGVEAGYNAGVRVIFIQDQKPLTELTHPMVYDQASNLLEVVEMLK